MKAFLIIIFVIIVLYLACTIGLFLFGCRRFRHAKVSAAAMDDSFGNALEEYSGVIKDGISWYKAQYTEKTEIRSYDGLTLRATLLPAEKCRGVLVSFHGYRSSPMRDLGASVKYYHDMGFTVILPSQRACADSEGKYVTFGVRERHDVKSWVDYAAERFGGDTPLVLGGISLGSASVLMSLGLKMPANLRCAVADCGYGSIEEEFKSVLKRYFHLPPQPILSTVNLWCRLFAGFDMHDCDVREIMKANTLPVLFIHGEADDFVPTRFSRENYAACGGEKELFTVPGAGHGMSYLVDMDGYHKTLEAFLNKYVPRKENGND